MMNKKPRVVAIIPCYNTAPYIAEVVIEARKYVDEVIVVDDGSTDDTADEAKKAGARVIQHECNLGKGAAMKEAALVADCDIIVFLDGDGQHDPSEIPVLTKPMIAQKYEAVIGSRHLIGSKISFPIIERRLANMLASIIISTITNAFLPLIRLLKFRNKIESLGPKIKGMFVYYRNSKTKRIITDCTTGFRAISSNRWQELDLTSNGFQIETEMIYELRKHRVELTEVPTSCKWNGNISSLSIAGDGFKTLKMLGKKLVHDFRTM